MTQELRIELRIILPDGARFAVASVPPAAPVIDATPDEPPWPAETIPEAAARAFPDAKLDPDQRPVAVAAAPRPACPVHNVELVRYPAGTSQKTGKPFNASWRCDVKDCEVKPIWDKGAA